MSEITRVQFAVAALVVAILAWTAARGGAPRASGGGAVAAAPAVAAPRSAGARGEPGTGTDDGGGVVVTRASKPRIVVHVAGAVRHPGVYRLRDGQRVADAVKRAGGASASADLDAINLATKARDGVQILVPRMGVATATTGPASGVAASGGAAGPAAPAIVNLNTATAEQLETLDGVGPATATKILRYRAERGPFRSVDDLEQIPGIGPKKLAAMRAGVTV